MNFNIKKSRRTILSEAVQRGNHKLVKLLLDNGADPNFENQTYHLNHRYIIGEMLIEKGYKIPKGFLAVVFHSSKRNEDEFDMSSVDFTKYLLKKGANPFEKSNIDRKDLSIFDINKKNPLMVYYNSYEFQKWLLEKYDIEAVPFLMKNKEAKNYNGIRANKQILKDYNSIFKSYENGNKLGLI